MGLAVRRSTTTEHLSVLERLARLEVRVHELEERLSPHGPRDAADLALMHALALHTDGEHFTAAGIWRRRAVVLELRDALEACDVCSVRQLGKLLKRLTSCHIGDLVLPRVGSNREGAVLRVSRE